MCRSERSCLMSRSLGSQPGAPCSPSVSSQDIELELASRSKYQSTGCVKQEVLGETLARSTPKVLRFSRHHMSYVSDVFLSDITLCQIFANCVTVKD